MRAGAAGNGKGNVVKPTTIRRGRYEPPLPETQSKLSRWIVRVEITLTMLAALRTLALVNRAQNDDATPVKVAIAPAPLIVTRAADAVEVDDDADIAKGQALYMQTCTACHGQSAQGMPHMGVNLRQSKFVFASSDLKLRAFLQTGRPPNHPSNTTGLPMPARGGNPGLDDEALADIVAFLRRLQSEPDTKKGG
jgi:disulfide bond formation protein DsbB